MTQLPADVEALATSLCGTGHGRVRPHTVCPPCFYHTVRARTVLDLLEANHWALVMRVGPGVVPRPEGEP